MAVHVSPGKLVERVGAHTWCTMHGDAIRDGHWRVLIYRVCTGGRVCASWGKVALNMYAYCNFGQNLDAIQHYMYKKQSICRNCKSHDNWNKIAETMWVDRIIFFAWAWFAHTQTTSTPTIISSITSSSGTPSLGKATSNAHHSPSWHQALSSRLLSPTLPWEVSSLLAWIHCLQLAARHNLTWDWPSTQMHPSTEDLVPLWICCWLIHLCCFLLSQIVVDTDVAN